MPGTSVMSPVGALRDLQLLFGGTILVLVFFKAILPLFWGKSKAWHLNPGTATGVDAAEKGDTTRLLLEKVPYDLQKRAILHKVSSSWV